MDNHVEEIESEDQQSLSQDIDVGVNIGVGATLRTLVDLGLLVKLDGDSGYNGITNPRGVSNDLLFDQVSDCVSQTISDIVLEYLKDNAQGDDFLDRVFDTALNSAQEEIKGSF